MLGDALHPARWAGSPALSTVCSLHSTEAGGSEGQHGGGGEGEDMYPVPPPPPPSLDATLVNSVINKGLPCWLRQ